MTDTSASNDFNRTVALPANVLVPRTGRKCPLLLQSSLVGVPPLGVGDRYLRHRMRRPDANPSTALDHIGDLASARSLGRHDLKRLSRNQAVVRLREDPNVSEMAWLRQLSASSRIADRPTPVRHVPRSDPHDANSSYSQIHAIQEPAT